MNRLCEKHTENCCWFHKCLCLWQARTEVRHFTEIVLHVDCGTAAVASQPWAVFSGWLRNGNRTHVCTSNPACSERLSQSRSRRSHCTEPGWGAGTCAEPNGEPGKRNQRDGALQGDREAGNNEIRGEKHQIRGHSCGFRCPFSFMYPHGTLGGSRGDRYCDPALPGTADSSTAQGTR